MGERLEKTGGGVRLEGKEGRTVNTLLYADDIIMMSEKREELQKLMDTVAKCSNEWR